MGGGGGDSGTSKPSTSKVRFLLGFRALHFENIEKIKNRYILRIIPLKIPNSGGTSHPGFWTGGRTRPVLYRRQRPWVLITSRRLWSDHLEPTVHTLLAIFLSDKLDHLSEPPTSGFITVWKTVQLQALRDANEVVHRRL